MAVRVTEVNVTVLQNVDARKVRITMFGVTVLDPIPPDQQPNVLGADIQGQNWVE